MQHEHSIPCLSAFEQHHNDLLRFFTHKLGCRDLAADCTQETYVHLVRMRSTIDVQNPRAFLFRVAANLAVDNLRKLRIRREALSAEPLPENTASPAPSADDALDAKQRLSRLERAIGEPPQMQKRLVDESIRWENPPGDCGRVRSVRKYGDEICYPGAEALPCPPGCGRDA